MTGVIGRDRASLSSYSAKKERAGAADLPMTANNSIFYFHSYQPTTWDIVPSLESNGFMD